MRGIILAVSEETFCSLVVPHEEAAMIKEYKFIDEVALAISPCLKDNGFPFDKTALERGIQDRRKRNTIAKNSIFDDNLIDKPGIPPFKPDSVLILEEINMQLRETLPDIYLQEFKQSLANICFTNVLFKSKKKMGKTEKLLSLIHKFSISNILLTLIVDSEFSEKLAYYHSVKEDLRDISVTFSDESSFRKHDCRLFDLAISRIGLGINETLVYAEGPFDVLGAHRSNLPVFIIEELSSGFDEIMLPTKFLDPLLAFRFSQSCDVSILKLERLWGCKKPFEVGIYLNTKKKRNFVSRRIFEFPHRRDIKFFDFGSSHDESNMDVEQIRAVIWKPTDLLQSYLLNNTLVYPCSLVDKLSKNNDFSLFDKMENILPLLDRRIMMAKCKFLDNVTGYSFPKSKVGKLSNDSIEDLSFPMLCKTLSACGPSASHDMIYIPSESAFEALPFLCDSEFLFQEYIDHDAFLVKGYVIGDHVFIETRPSLPNSSQIAQNECTFFNSHKISEAFSEIIVFEDLPCLSSSDLDSIKHLAAQVRKNLSLNLFGFDVIFQSTTHQGYLVDVNYFPSYKCVKHLGEALLSVVFTKVNGNGIYLV